MPHCIYVFCVHFQFTWWNRECWQRRRKWRWSRESRPKDVESDGEAEKVDQDLESDGEAEKVDKDVESDGEAEKVDKDVESDDEAEKVDEKQTGFLAEIYKIETYANSVTQRVENLLKSQRDALQKLQDVAFAYIDSLSPNTGNDILKVMEKNLTYASRTLFRSSSAARQRQLKMVTVGEVFFQTQGYTNYCGTCCLNNLLGPDNYGNFPISVQEMDAEADRLWLSVFTGDAAVELGSMAVVMRDIEGFYDVTVLQAVARNHSCCIQYVDANIALSLNSRELVKNLCTTDDELLGFIINVTADQHWVCMKVESETTILIDSKEETVQHFNMEQSGDCIKSYIRGWCPRGSQSVTQGSVFVVTRRSTSRDSVPAVMYNKALMKFIVKWNVDYYHRIGG